MSLQMCNDINLQNSAMVGSEKDFIVEKIGLSLWFPLKGRSSKLITWSVAGYLLKVNVVCALRKVKHFTWSRGLSCFMKAKTQSYYFKKWLLVVKSVVEVIMTLKRMHPLNKALISVGIIILWQTIKTSECYENFQTRVAQSSEKLL